MAEVDLDELERLEREASDGPWREDDGTGWGVLRTGDYPRRGVIVVNDSTNTPGRDAPFLIALRNAALELIAAARERDALRREVGELRGLLAEPLTSDAEIATCWAEEGLTCTPDEPCETCVWRNKAEAALRKDKP